MSDQTRGERVVSELQQANGYDPQEDGSVDDLIAYKNALEDRLMAALDRPGLTVTLASNHPETNHDAGLAAMLRRVACQIEDGELCGTVYNTTGDDFLGSFDLTYHDTGQRVSDLAARGDVSDPRGGDAR